MTEYEKMKAGDWIVTNDPEIVRRNREATRLWREFSQTGTDDEPTWRKAMSALLPNAHPTAVVKPPFRCDFGTEIYLGEKAFINFNCTILDGAKVTVVVDDMPEDVMVAGNPARIKKNLSAPVAEDGDGTDKKGQT